MLKTSPFLFNIDLRDLEHYLMRQRVNGVDCDLQNYDISRYLKLWVILYADDTVLLSDNKNDLQLALNVFINYCLQWKLQVYIKKDCCLQ